MTSLKKILIVSYYWPPSGGPGVQRILKFSKYLPEFGYKPILLTVKNGVYPSIDNSLTREIPKICDTYKSYNLEPANVYKLLINKDLNSGLDNDILAKSDSSLLDKISKFIRMNFFIPDAKIGWIPFALHKGARIIKKEKPDIIISSSPPPSCHLIALILSRWSGIKWIADFRDPWTKIHYYNKRKRLLISALIDNFLEKKVVRSCDQLISVSKSFLNLLPFKKNRAIITNGFDPSDFPNKRLLSKSNKFSITYMGTLTENRFYEDYFKIISKFFTKHDNHAELELNFVGKITHNIKNRLKDIFHNFPNVSYKGYLDHAEALKQISKSEILLLFMENIPGYEGHIPGKLFDYLATGNFILGIGEQGDAYNIIKKCRCGTVVDNKTYFEETLERQYSKWKNRVSDNPDFSEIDKYSRGRLTKKLADVINKLLSEN